MYDSTTQMETLIKGSPAPNLPSIKKNKSNKDKQRLDKINMAQISIGKRWNSFKKKLFQKKDPVPDSPKHIEIQQELELLQV